ncbi:MAG: GNAT family N-acetyltransferase [Clostridia bacterium]|nr:GNAT family N-acetyltransferase [Clostridia bacterium]
MTFQPLETERLMIRRFRPDDAAALYTYLSKESVVRYEPYDPYTPEQARREAEYRSRSEDFFAVTLKDGTLIGNVYLGRRELDCAELGFVFDDRWQRCGYATEASRAILNYAFGTLQKHRVIAGCDVRNVRSWKLMERLGMRREGAFRQSTYYKRDPEGHPMWIDTFQYAILKDEWENN